MTTGRPTTLALNGMVASPHYLASAAGLRVLTDGGSAMDAAVTTNAVLTVIYPDQTSIGGDCLLLGYNSATQTLHGLNGSGRAPAAANAQRIREAGHKRMPRDGIETVTVPGTIDAWDVALTRFGRFGLDRALQPAINYARDGFPVSPRLSAAITTQREALDVSETLRRLYLPRGMPPNPGDRLRLPELAHTLELIARDGRDAFYEGSIGEKIGATAAQLGGALTLADLAAHRAEWVEPIQTEYRGVQVATMPPNSQGLTALLGLNLLKQVARGKSWGTAHHLHPMIEAKKLAFAVRDRNLADPNCVPIDTERFLSREFAAELWRLFNLQQALRGAPEQVGDTVFVCAVDRDGNAVALIQSMYQGFGSRVAVGDTGVLLHNRGTNFSLEPGHPNELAGGKRPLHTLMPAILLRDGALLGPIGTQGGDAQAQVLMQLVSNLIDFDMEP
nr:gamma-glutamyltransferase family protein [Chloroflexota bacterium]